MSIILNTLLILFEYVEAAEALKEASPEVAANAASQQNGEIEEENEADEGSESTIVTPALKPIMDTDK